MYSISGDPESSAPAGHAPAPIKEVEAELLTLAGHLAAAQCRFLGLLAEFDQRDGWAGPGLRSCAHWLSWRIGMSLRTATEHLRVAHALRALPAIQEAFAAGRLSYSKVRAVTRIATRSTESDLLDLALAGTTGHVERVVRAARQQAADPVVATARRAVTWHWDDEGMLVLRGRLGPAEGAALVAAIEAAAEHQVDTARDEPIDARRADALHHLATTDPGRSATVVLHVGENAGSTRLEGGPALPPSTAERLACDGRVRLLLFGRGRLYLGRTHRLASPTQIAALCLQGGKRCRYPGCTHRRHLHAHHIRHWLHGGTTDVDNLVLLCSFHHRRLHDHGYRVHREEGGDLSFRRPDGTTVPSTGEPLNGDSDRLIQLHERFGPRIDPEGLTPSWAGERLDLTPILSRLLAAEPATARIAA